MTFLSETGEPLVTFTLDELYELERATFNTYESNETMRVLFTEDGSSWFGGPFQLGRAGGFVFPHVLEDALITTQLEGPHNQWDPRTDSYRFAIVEAPLPSQ